MALMDFVEKANSPYLIDISVKNVEMFHGMSLQGLLMTGNIAALAHRKSSIFVNVAKTSDNIAKQRSKTAII
jgi:hypothetical protein